MYFSGSYDEEFYILASVNIHVSQNMDSGQ